MSSEAEKDDSGSVPAPPIEAAALTASSEAGADNSYGAWSSWAMGVAANAKTQLAPALETMQEKAKEYSVIASEHAKVMGEQAKELSVHAQAHAAKIAEKAVELHQDLNVAEATGLLLNLGLNQGLAADLANSKSASGQNKSSPNVLDLSYITENVIGMAMPYEPERARTHGGNDIRAVAGFLKRRHEGHYMIWNISEEGYDYNKFDDQVLEYRFPGLPAPPLGLMFKICTSIESWLDADEKNVAIVHCLTGKGRTAALLACLLTWIGEFASPAEALQYIADRKRISMDYLAIPSQQRYVQYFSNMLDGVKPRSEHLLLRRVIINSIPNFGSDGTNVGCTPYIQLFKNGKLISTACPSSGTSGYSKDEEESGGGEKKPEDKMALKFVSIEHGSISFTVDTPVNGDILLRCRHADPSGARHSMFRAAFHTGYVPCGVLRLTKVQLDGANTDTRFDEDFFVDLIFAPIDTSESGNIQSGGTPAKEPTDSGLKIDEAAADKYEQSLHRDAKFWDAITNRKQKSRKRRSRKFLSNQQEQFSIDESDHGDEEDRESSSRFDNLSSPVPAKSTNNGGMSDEDLIALLGNVEDDIAAAITTPAKTDTHSTSSYTVDETTVTSTISSMTPEAQKELLALDDLEKELGLDDMNLFSGKDSESSPVLSSTSKTPAKQSAAGTPAKDIADLDDLDDIEEYLNSLNN